MTPFLPNLPAAGEGTAGTLPLPPPTDDSPHQPGEVSGRYDPLPAQLAAAGEVLPVHFPSLPPRTTHRTSLGNRRGTAGTLPLPPPTDDSPHQPGEVSGRYDPLPAQLAAAGEVLPVHFPSLPPTDDSPHQPGEVSGRYDPLPAQLAAAGEVLPVHFPLPPPTDDSPHQPGEVSGRYDPLPAQLAAAGEVLPVHFPSLPPRTTSPHQPGEVSGRYDPLPAQLAAAGEVLPVHFPSLPPRTTHRTSLGK
ncbi:hypothetical protein ACJJTC_001848 [Scirpophaga incertulas]